MKTIISTNPAKNYAINGSVIATLTAEIDQVVITAQKVKQVWQQVDVKTRVEYLKKALDIFRAHQEEIAALIVKEIGNPTAEVNGLLKWDWTYWEWFLANVEKALSPTITFESDTTIHQLYYEPRGVVAVITPWNLPLEMFLWGVIPNLLAGNVVIYKASEECILSGQFYSQLMQEVELPTGVFTSIYGDGEEGAYLTNSTIDSIWFTGSSEVGQKLYTTASNKFIHASLEMGGSNPVIVFPDADLELAAKNIVANRFMFSGQTCDADKRLIVHQDIADSLLAKIQSHMSKFVVGDPTLPDTTMGSLASRTQQELISKQVKNSILAGAKIIFQVKINPNLKGAFYPPTILGNVTKDMPTWKEEVFGPVLPVITFSSEEEALKLANDTIYGLGSQLYTNDKTIISRFSKELKAGNVCVNLASHWIPQNPFGGYKLSGMGREHGIEGLHELCQIKTVSIPK